MPEIFDRVKQYLFDMEIPIISEVSAEKLVVVEDEENGIKNLIIDCEEPILILEQVIMKVPQDPGDLFKRLLQMNRDVVHGAFVLALGPAFGGGFGRRTLGLVLDDALARRVGLRFVKRRA